MQECLIRLWKLESEKPGRTRSWYLQNCRFHLQHWLASGRSVDSPKRANGNNRITIDGTNDELPVDTYHTNGELLDMVSARDIVLTLACHLKPRVGAVLGGLSDGLSLNEIALKLKLTYPTALKYRRNIAALTIKLGISPPLPYERDRIRRARRANGVGNRPAGAQINGVKRHNPFPNIFQENLRAESNGNGRRYANGFKPVIKSANGKLIPIRAA